MEIGVGKSTKIEKINDPAESNRTDAYGEYADMWYQRTWRPMMAAIYMVLCVLDYGVRPIINYYQSTNFNLATVVKTIEPLDPIVQIEVINAAKRETITPILTEFVHLAFGAILGVAAFSRGSAKGFSEGSPMMPLPRRPPSPTVHPNIRRPRRRVDNPDDEEADG